MRTSAYISHWEWDEELGNRNNKNITMKERLRLEEEIHQERTDKKTTAQCRPSVLVDMPWTEDKNTDKSLEIIVRCVTCAN